MKMAKIDFRGKRGNQFLRYFLIALTVLLYYRFEVKIFVKCQKKFVIFSKNLFKVS